MAEWRRWNLCYFGCGCRGLTSALIKIDGERRDAIIDRVAVLLLQNHSEAEA